MQFYPSRTIRPVLISVHLPKTSGVSFRTAFTKAFPRRVHLDYSHDPVDPAVRGPSESEDTREQLPVDREIRVVHGHFYIHKYDDVQHGRRCVLLRDPIDNIISIYYFWKHLIASGHCEGHALFASFQAERPSIVDFARYPTFRYLFSRTFFDGYDMARFDVIGDFAERKRYAQALSELLGVRLDMSVHDNRTPPSDERSQSRNDPRLIRSLRDLLRDDICFYERWAGRIAA